MNVSRTQRPQFCDSDKEKVATTWITMQKELSHLGVITFVSMFETHPETQRSFFDFKHMTRLDMTSSKALQQHGLRVMRVVDKVINRFEKVPDIEKLLWEIGARHMGYNVQMAYIDLMGPQFVKAIRPLFDTEAAYLDAQDAWLNFFKWISHIMKEAML